MRLIALFGVLQKPYFLNSVKFLKPKSKSFGSHIVYHQPCFTYNYRFSVFSELKYVYILVVLICVCVTAVSFDDRSPRKVSRFFCQPGNFCLDPGNNIWRCCHLDQVCVEGHCCPSGSVLGLKCCHPSVDIGNADNFSHSYEENYCLNRQSDNH